MQLLDASGHVRKTLATDSNLDAGASDRHGTLDAGVAIGKTVMAQVHRQGGQRDGDVFVVDDVSLEVR